MLTFGDKKSAIKYINSLRSMLRIYEHSCSCKYCEREGVELVKCKNCDHRFYEYDNNGWTVEKVRASIEKDYDNKCPKCGVDLKDRESDIMRIKNLYGIKN